MGSKNPVKVEAVCQAFGRIFPEYARAVEIVGVAAESGVSAQPRGERETRRGARNRAEDAARRRPEADYWVGLEGGVAELVRAGVELGEADDRVFGRTGSKWEEGAVGLLTGGAVTRTELYAQAVALALCRFVHPELYGEGEGDGAPGSTA